MIAMLHVYIGMRVASRAYDEEDGHAHAHDHDELL
eukprot:CAMPEP_0181306496 /NCGR_PEP_ID=MMETSP1101-20121128/10333_1 /TAXON_ID=46948 /ORGANISM="Rhodomonas abbreviata, Strain Caron Lab Isolate" /LENGTH=34 /DNA_ID= /DNA_START= /DNA_END= /DNA_ORIENTATION=